MHGHCIECIIDRVIKETIMNQLAQRLPKEAMRHGYTTNKL